MSHSHEDFPRYVRTAGKITIVTAVAGLVVFLFAFMYDVGNQELNHASAANGNATTTLTVLNTPPAFTLNPYEVIGSATSTPTNSGDVIQWSAIAEDSNSAPYFLLICSNNASPTPDYQDIGDGTGIGEPACDGTAVQWGVSASTTSGALATVSTTTEEWGTGQFVEVSHWYAWVCDDDAVNPRCSNFSEQGDYATSSSPFHINNRPVFTDFANNGPADPGGTITFNSTSSDPDSVGGEDTIYVVVCNTIGWATSTDTCFDSGDFIASTTLTTILSDVAATYTIPSIMRDDTYPAYGYVFDEHGHEALGNYDQADFIISNVAPTVLGGDITIYGVNGPGDPDLEVNIPEGETPSSTLEFTIRDANSCLNAASTSEITNFVLSVYRGTSTDGTAICDGSGTNYDPNDCYESGVPAATWNLSCSATTTCASPLQDYMDYSCDFPLWFVADPTDAGVNTPLAFANDVWFAAVAGADDNYATGTMATTSNPVELKSFSAIDILLTQIAYGAIEPGDDSGTLDATSTAQNVGNTGLDQEVRGESMCDLTFHGVTVGNCPNYATSSIPDWRQQLSTTTYAYDADATEGGGLLDPRILQLSSTTNQELELNVNKTTATSTPQEGTTYWGIAVPISITLAGSYTGLNTFTAKTAEAADW